MNSTTSRPAYAQRILLWTTIVVSAAVVAFAVWTILYTDRMTDNTVQMYEAGYDAMMSARTLQSGLLRMQGQVEAYLSDPNSEAGRAVLSDINQWYRRNSDMLDEIDTLLTEEERATYEEELQALFSAQNQVFAAAQSGDKLRAAQLYSSQLSPIFDTMDAKMESAVDRGEDMLRRAAADNRAMNMQINTGSVLIASIVVGLCCSMGILCAREVSRHDAELYNAKQIFMLIAENTSEVFEVSSLDDGNLSYVSNNLLELFGVQPSEYISDNTMLLNNILAEDRYRLAEWYFNLGRTGPQEFEFRYTNPATGQQQVFQSVLRIVRDDDGNDKYRVLITRDVTDDRKARQRMQAALNEAEYASRTRREFLSRMSHEIRTPINAIIGMDALAASSLDDPEKTARYLQNINVSARHLLGLVNDVLDMTKIESETLEMAYEPFSLDALISDLRVIVGPRVAERDQVLTIDTSRCSEKRLIGDELRLRQVLLNFLSNANKYTAVGGAIRLDVRQNPVEYGFVKTEFSVTDNGCGIAGDELARIFEPFERGEDVVDGTSGTGLGLSIGKHVIEEMGGTIHARSEPGKGSVFSFEVSLGIAQTSDSSELPTYATAVSDIAAESKDLLAGEHECLSDDSSWKGSAETALDARVISEGHPEGSEGTDEPTPDSSLHCQPDEENTASAPGGPLPAGTTGDKDQGVASDETSSALEPRLLVVEDNAINMEIARELLTQAGFQVVEAANGEEAVSLFEEAPQGHYGAVLMDIQMPIMDGRTAMKRIRESAERDGLSIPIYAMTADPFIVDDLHGPRGFNGCIAKPIDANLLISTMRSATTDVGEGPASQDGAL